MLRELRRRKKMKMDTPKSLLTQSWKTVQMPKSTEKGMRSMARTPTETTSSLPI